jgi:Plasmid Fertility inhibition factor
VTASRRRRGRNDATLAPSPSRVSRSRRTSKRVSKPPRGSWVGGLAEWTLGDTAFLSIVFTWKLPEARARAVIVRKIDESWRDDPVPWYYIPRGACDEHAFGHWLKHFSHRERAWMPHIGYDGFVSFLNGRHRFGWCRDHGVRAMPVSVESKEQARMIQTLFGSASRVCRVPSPKFASPTGARRDEGQFAPDVNARFRPISSRPTRVLTSKPAGPPDVSPHSPKTARCNTGSEFPEFIRETKPRQGSLQPTCLTELYEAGKVVM